MGKFDQKFNHLKDRAPRDTQINMDWHLEFYLCSYPYSRLLVGL